MTTAIKTAYLHPLHKRTLAPGLDSSHLLVLMLFHSILGMALFFKIVGFKTFIVFTLHYCIILLLEQTR
jgi:hypothetical protein